MNLKIPAIGGISILVILVVVNLVKGNTLLVTSLRSLLSGVIVFGIMIGIQYIFQNVLEIDFDSLKNGKPAGNEDAASSLRQTDLESQDNGENVDIILDDESIGGLDSDLSIDNGEKDSTDLISVGDDVSLTNDESAGDTLTPVGTDSSMSEDVSLNELDANDNTENINFVDSDSDVLPDINDLDLEKTGSENESNSASIEDDLGISDEEDYSTSSASEPSLKDTLGFDASFEDMAKAIRTKLKKDD